jgi:arylsulfatase A-like enzyme
MGLLTGRWPIRWGMMHSVVRPWETAGLPPEEETLAELLAWEGYARRAFVGKWHLGHARRDLHPLRQGFTEFYGHYNGQIDYFTHVSRGEVDWHRDFEPLDETGVAEDTIVWFLSDNGGVESEGASNDPLREEKRTPYEGGVRVPAIVRWPRGGLDGGRVSDALVGYIDVAPTLRRMIGARRPVFRRFDGSDVLDVLRGRSREPRREWFTYYYRHWSFTPEHTAITTNTWKLVRHGWSILMDPDFETPVELYRIRDDPTESTDVAESHPEVVHELLCRLFAYRSLQPEGSVPFGYPQAPSGWRAPAHWEIPPDADPASAPGRSRAEFAAEPRWSDTPPGCRRAPFAGANTRKYSRGRKS